MEVVSLALLSQLFDNLPLGIVVLDGAGKVLIYNRAEELLAGRRREQVIGRQFFTEVGPCMNVRQLGGEFTRRIGHSALDVNVEFSFPFPYLEEPRDVRVKMSSFDVGNAPYAFLMIEDISARRSVDRMKETLQSLLVHDLRNPLAAVLGNLQFLETFDGIRDSQDAKDAISDSLGASRRIQAMLLNLLDITRLETNSLPLHRTELDLGALLGAVLEGNAALAKLHHTELSVDLPSPVRAFADADVLRRALDNLVENGLRQAKHVSLSATRRGDLVVLEVRDDGPGIPEAIRVAIFEKYVQVAAARAQTSQNRGLGLTFVRLAARAHGGDAEVECPASGGSVFRITISSVAAPSVRPSRAPPA